MLAGATSALPSFLAQRIQLRAQASAEKKMTQPLLFKEKKRSKKKRREAKRIEDKRKEKKRNEKKRREAKRKEENQKEKKRTKKKRREEKSRRYCFQGRRAAAECQSARARKRDGAAYFFLRNCDSCSSIFFVIWSCCLLFMLSYCILEKICCHTSLFFLSSWIIMEYFPVRPSRCECRGGIKLHSAKLF